jgi:hypothetical protein
MTHIRRTLTGLVAAAALALALAPSASAAEATCPGSFEVLHNDRIGAMQLPAGPYTITVLDSATMGCTEASHLFSQFLEDWDGRLPRPWVADNATRTFRAGRGSSVGFRVTSGAPTPPLPPNPPHPPSSRVCAGYFTVLHNDRIGSFSIPRGRYRITLLGYSGVTCSQASTLFARFLQDFDGILPRPWFLDPSTGSFMRGSRHVGFRIKPYVDDGGTSNGGRYPVRGETRCPTFRVLHNDRIGRLALPRGTYNVWVRGRLTCAQSTRLFVQFLDAPTGDLPSPWVVNARSASFSRGPGSPTGFRVKPVR